MKVRSVARSVRDRLVRDQPWWDHGFWKQHLTFQLAGRTFTAFVSRHNCGWPAHRMTERAVELSLADYWLETVDRARLYEIGAVTPYYWPWRVLNVVDPQDAHPLVTVRQSLFDVDLTARPVLSISTLEHIGTGQYGLTEPRTSTEAVEKIYRESDQFLLTVPYGYNRDLDVYLTRGDLQPRDVRILYLVRSLSGNDWKATADASALPPYGDGSTEPPGRAQPSSRAWANALIILIRGPFA